MEVARQATERGHSVTAFVRAPDRLGALKNQIAVKKGDLLDSSQLAKGIEGHDAVISAFGPRLPAHGRCVTSRDELTKLARRAPELSCYVVEVCPDCEWNHLARTFLLGRRNRG